MLPRKMWYPSTNSYFIKYDSIKLTKALPRVSTNSRRQKFQNNSCTYQLYGHLKNNQVAPSTGRFSIFNNSKTVQDKRKTTIVHL